MVNKAATFLIYAAAVKIRNNFVDNPQKVFVQAARNISQIAVRNERESLK